MLEKYRLKLLHRAPTWYLEEIDTAKTVTFPVRFDPGFSSRRNEFVVAMVQVGERSDIADPNS